MILKIITRINLPFLEWEMRIQSLFLGAASREMFSHGGNAGSIQPVSLKTKNIGFCHFCTKSCIFSKCTADPWPARFCSQINLRMQRLPYPDSQIFLSGDICELPGEVFIADCRQTKWLTPL